MRRLSGMQKGVEQRMAVVMGDYNGNACMGFGAIAADSVASGRRGGRGGERGGKMGRGGSRTFARSRPSVRSNLALLLLLLPWRSDPKRLARGCGVSCLRHLAHGGGRRHESADVSAIRHYYLPVSVGMSVSIQI